MRVLAWSDQLERTHGDPKAATEGGACGLAILAIETLYGLSVESRSPADGGGFDYYLRPRFSAYDEDEDHFLLDTQVLEVSGILNGTAKDVAARLREKIGRFKTTLPQFVVLVWFRGLEIRIWRSP